jgi:hypothetical protein
VRHLIVLALISSLGCGVEDPHIPAPVVDSDGDGVPDNTDAFPDDPNESADSDGDGIGDNADGCPGFVDDNCFNGDCSTGTCECAIGYAGVSCDTCAAEFQDNDSDGECDPACPAGACNDRGACDDTSGIATCTCDLGYAGTDCASCAGGYQDNDGDGECRSTCATASLACGDHGACSDADGNADCACIEGYAGPACDTCAGGYQDNDGDDQCR